MPSYRSELVSGRKAPYDRWTFAVVPAEVWRALGGEARIDVAGTVAGVPFRATVQKGEGVYRFCVPREVRTAAGVGVGDQVDIRIDVDREPRPVEVPPELREVLEAEGLMTLFEGLSPSHRRAWAQHVAEAKKSETRVRRAGKAPEAIRARRYPGQR